MVGLIPLIAVTVLEQDVIDRLPGFNKRMEWFLNNRRDLYQQISMMEVATQNREGAHRIDCWPFPRARACSACCSRMLDETRVSVALRHSLAFRAVTAEHPYTLASTARSSA